MNTDLHTAKAAKIFSKDAKDVTPAERKVGKRQNYVELYSTDALATSPEQQRFFAKPVPTLVRGRGQL